MRFNFPSRFLVVCCCVFFLVGCNQTVKNYWKDTKGVYYSYVNKPATVDVSDAGVDYSIGEGLIGSSMPVVNKALSNFERSVFSVDRKPAPEWVSLFLDNFSWINGVAIIDTEGNVVNQWPSTSTKPLDFAPLLNVKLDTQDRVLSSYVQETSLGPEVYLAAPIYEKGEHFGYFVSYFDPRTLFSRIPEAMDVAIAVPNFIIWSGKYNMSGSAVASTDWSKQYRDDRGVVGSGGNSFSWVCRFFGTTPFIFAAPNSEVYAPLVEEQADAKKEAVEPADQVVSPVSSVSTEGSSSLNENNIE